jgi:hypothetical protein
MRSRAEARVDRGRARPAERQQAEPARSRAPAEARPTEADPVTNLQHAAGNRAVAGLFEPYRIAGRSAAPATVVAQRGPGDKSPTKAPVAGGSGGKPAAAGTVDELVAAEAWLRYVALRGNSAVPSGAVPDRYRGTIASIQAAVGGPGPIPARELVVDELRFGDARATLKRLRSDHDSLTPKAGHDVYELADVGIERGQLNARGGANTFEGGATQLDQAQVLNGIRGAADDEVKEATAAGYTLPKELANLPSEAAAQFDASKEGWERGAPSHTRRVTPTDEMDLVDFINHATDVINSMRARRAADIARARDKEADQIREAADKQLAELQILLADKRRAAFMAGEEGTLKKLHSAIGQVVSAIDETKEAAGHITDQVDRLNAAAKLFTTKGTALINLPKMPESIGAAAGKLASANKKLGLVIDLLDLVGPAKTELEGGLKILKGIDMALDSYASRANPIFALYVTAYLGPGIRNCMRGIGTIASIMSRQNRDIIASGDPRFLTQVQWSVEPGGEAAYLFLAQVFKAGGAAALNDAAWDYFDDHRDDLSAAVGDPMPKGRRSVPGWAARHRLELWQSFYGSTTPPR